MRITYKFNNLGEIAEWLRDKATKLRMAESVSQKEQRFAEGQAYAYEQAAEILESAEIEQ
jgi:hypothetical protein